MDLTKEILEILNSDVKMFEGNAKVLALFADGFEDKANELNDLFALHIVSRSKLKETLDNLLDIVELLKDAENEVDNGIYDPIEEFAKIIINRYEISKK